jgi:hypothetical protein
MEGVFLVKWKTEQRIAAARAAEQRHKENIVLQKGKLIEAQRLLDRSERLLQEAVDRRSKHEKLLSDFMASPAG